MNCKNCGAPLRDDQNFCSYCGAKVEKQQYEYNDPSFITFENIVGNNFNNNFEEERFSSKSKFVALFLALFIGYGSHSFYLGHTKKGIIQLSISLIGFIVGLISQFLDPALFIAGVLYYIYVFIALAMSIWYLVEAILIATGKIKDKDGNRLR